MIIVIGAGIAGSSLVHHLDERGIEYRHLASADSASTTSVALLRRGYHHGDQLALFDRSLELLKKWHTPVRQGGLVTNYRTPDRAPRHEDDWYLVNPLSPLLNAEFRGEARPVSTDGVLLEGPEGERFWRGQVIWATGAALHPAGLTFGVTWIHDRPDVLNSVDELRLHHYAPYKTIAAACVNGQARLGSSSARTDVGAMEQAKKMLQAAYEVGIINSLTGWTAEIGIRCKGVEAQPPCGQYFGGFHRTGYAIAPAAAERLVAAL
jgi:hypothetical protein